MFFFMCFLCASASCCNAPCKALAVTSLPLISGWMRISLGSRAVYFRGPLIFARSCVAIVAASLFSQIPSCSFVWWLHQVMVSFPYHILFCFLTICCTTIFGDVTEKHNKAESNNRKLQNNLKGEYQIHKKMNWGLKKK